MNIPPAVARVLAALDHPKPNPRGWEAHCPGPAHVNKDRTASLGILPADNGGCILACAAGCPAAAIIEALGLTQHMHPGKVGNTYFLNDGEAGASTEGHMQRAAPKARKI